MPSSFTEWKEMIYKDDAFEWVMENFYDEVKEQVFEQEAEAQRE